MSRLPYTLYRAADVRELDRIAIHEFGTPGIELMNRAGAALFDELCSRWPEAGRIAVICGAGNNAGDGYVLARLAHEQGLAVVLCSLADPARLQGDARTAWGAAQAAGLTASGFDPALLAQADVIVDAIFGIGLDRAVEGRWAEAIEAINAAALPVLSVDIPSGLHADSGAVLGVAVRADATVTFIALKQGLFTAAGVDHCGEIYFNDLGIDVAVYDRVPVACERIDWLKLRALLPKRPRSAHKGVFGHALVIGGNHGMAGAARLAAEAALRSGSGLTSVATRPEHTIAMAAARPEAMWHGVDTAAQLRPLLQSATVIAIGPGLGQDAWAREMLAAALQSHLPLIVDADALNLLAQENFSRTDWILTPHPGEAGRLLGITGSEINRQRFDATRALAKRFEAVTVLKGAGSLISDAQGKLSLCSDGNPGMATGGMGDVLSGIIAAFVAQGFELNDAARFGVALHAAAADKVALSGERGMLAGDVISALRGLVN